MKKLVFFVLVVAAIGGVYAALSLQHPPAAVPGVEPGVNGEWIEDRAQAAELAKRYARPLVVLFEGSDWCLWCKKLEKETFTQADWKTFAAKNLVLLKCDFPHKTSQAEPLAKQNAALIDELKTENRFPTLVCLDPAGKELGRMGYFPGGPELFIPQLKIQLDPNDPARGPHN